MKFNKVKVVVPHGYIIDDICGDGVTEYEICSCLAHKFEKCKPRVYWGQEDESIDKDYVNINKCVVTDGEYCGACVLACFSKKGSKSLMIITNSGECIPLPEGLEIGSCDSAALQQRCEIENVSAQICAEEDMTIDSQYIIDLVNASGEVFNESGDVVDLNNPEHEIVGAFVQSYFCDTNVKKPDGEFFKVFSDQACVLSRTGIPIMQLLNGGKYLLGDTQEFNDYSNIIDIDESIFLPCGSGVTVCVTVKNITNEGK